jgi:hypothetical protein
MASDSTALTFVYARIVYRHNEDPGMAFLAKLQHIIDSLPADQYTYLDTTPISDEEKASASMHANGKDFLFWIYLRMANVYGENPAVDYVCKLLSIARAIPEAQPDNPLPTFAYVSLTGTRYIEEAFTAITGTAVCGHRSGIMIRAIADAFLASTGLHLFFSHSSEDYVFVGIAFAQSDDPTITADSFSDDDTIAALQKFLILKDFAPGLALLEPELRRFPKVS